MKKYSLPDGYSFLASIDRTLKQVKDPIGSMEESMSRYNGTYSVHLGFLRFISTQDPAFVEHVLKTNHRNYQKSEFQTRELGRFLGKGLLTSNGKFWLRQRRVIQPGFHYEKIQGLYSIIGKTVDNFLASFPTGSAIDVYPLMNRISFDIVINTLFNVTIEESRRAELGRFVYDTQDFVIRNIRQLYKTWWYELSGEVRANMKKAFRAREIIRELIVQRKQSDGKYNDLLDMMLDVRYEDTGQPMDEEQVIDEILVLIIAGHETTANALAWALYLLAKHPDQQQKLRAVTKGLELAEAVRSEDLGCVIKETMRLYPPVWIVDRVATSDDHFKDYSYPEGTIIMMFLYGMHRDKRFWTDPETFKPERFMKGGEGEKNKSYVPFGAGPRLCIGNNFAMAEMAIFLKSFLENFEIHAGPIPPKIVALITLKPDNIVLRVEKRHLEA
jgi:cytochrome P450